MTKNELIDAIVDCDDPEGTTPWGVKVDKFKALVQTAKGERETTEAPKAEEPAAPDAPVNTEEFQNTPAPAPEAPVEPTAPEPAPEAPAAPVEPAAAPEAPAAPAA